MKSEFLNYFQDIFKNLELYSWYDAVEILMLSAIVYYFLRWLNKDQSKRPILAFYGYFSLVVLTYYAKLFVVNTILLFGTPVFLVLLILMHQSSLQKNFITYKNISPNFDQNYGWIEELIRTFLASINKQKEVICVIECGDSLKEFLQSSYHLNADLKKEVLELFIQNMSNKGLLWINKFGKIIAINTKMKIIPDSVWLVPEVKDLPLWKQDAIFLTNKTDAIVIIATPENRSFNFIIQGKVIENLMPQHAIALLKKQLIQTNVKEDDNFNAYSNRDFSEQQLS